MLYTKNTNIKKQEVLCTLLSLFSALVVFFCAFCGASFVPFVAAFVRFRRLVIH
jgi:hypothetical protein